jgi:hypothetical protein
MLAAPRRRRRSMRKDATEGPRPYTRSKCDVCEIVQVIMDHGNICPSCRAWRCGGRPRDFEKYEHPQQDSALRTAAEFKARMNGWNGQTDVMRLQEMKDRE